MAVGVGLLSIMDAITNPAAWVFFQIFASCGLGIVLMTLLPAVLAGLPESMVATATATFSFVRSLGYIWGITIPSIVFNNQFDAHNYLISDVSLRERLGNGAAFTFVQSGQLSSLLGSVLAEVTQTYSKALSQVWYVGLAFPLLTFLLVFVEKQITLRTSLKGDFGVKEANQEAVTKSKIEKGEASEINAEEKHAGS